MTPQPLPSDKLGSPWFVYIAHCNDNSYYTGITTNLSRRLAEHNGDKNGGARYTRSRRPVQFVYSERLSCRAAATTRELQIKKMTPVEKQELIATATPIVSNAIK